MDDENLQQAHEERDGSVGHPVRDRSVEQLAFLSALLLWVLIFLMPRLASAAFDYSRGSTASYALGGAVRLFDSSPLDLTENPALVCSTRLSGAILATRLYNVADFDLGEAAAQYRNRAWSIGVVTSHLGGSEFYRERSYLLALSTGIGSSLRFGLSMDHQRIEFSEGYRGASAWLLAVGARYQLRERIVLAIAAQNVTRSRWSERVARMPITATASLSWRLLDDLSVHASHRYDPDLPDRFAIGQEWRVTKALRLLLGLTSNPTDVSGGIIIPWSRFEFEYAYRQNVYLGGSHRLGIRITR